jgi:hypothetical protein
MRMMQGVIMGVVTLVAVLALAGPAAAIRLSCDEVVALRQAGRTAEVIAQTYGTTRARVAACESLAQQNERFAARRDRFNLLRDERGLAH